MCFVWVCLPYLEDVYRTSLMGNNMSQGQKYASESTTDHEVEHS